ncbi:substrate-binding periplasmic protein [Pelagibaculum spongiae]|uniref:substrate-binding periplasmic protein n=1 Tax=Pelagibaculum spongiae TaxID=2080658 RepID=UPI000E30D6D2|nr:transporter substrate-binding domain-containing protein [Pelagibaculum spongiae]
MATESAASQVVPVNSNCSGCQQQISFAFSIGRPAPYVIDETKGIEVEIVRAALAAVDVELKPVWMSYLRMDRIAQLPLDGRGVTKPGLVPAPEVYYSQPYIYYQDVAITRTNDNLQLNRASDLKDYKIASWQSAANDLNQEFASLFADKGDYKKQFFPVVNDFSRTRLFWSGRVDVIVDDLIVFRQMTERLKRQDPKKHFRYQVHSLWPVRNWFNAAFVDKQHRDLFDQGLAKIIKNGRWQKIFEKYQAAPVAKTFLSPMKSYPDLYMPEHIDEINKDVWAGLLGSW